jgi:Rrf2 family transcriptional regulator, iron-sulfur cluster assembly transcription factor
MFVKLSNRGRYGVRALFDIAFHNDGRPTQVRHIAEREAIPPRFLEQIFQDLKRAGLVGAKRGPRGGYHLARPAPEIRLGDVVRALEGPISISGRSEERQRRPKDPRDATEAVFQELSEQIERCFDQVTVADICTCGEKLGLRRDSEAYVYVI